MKTPIRWAGSKRTLLPTLKKYWGPQYTRYIEPFCGSACLFFELEPKKAILNDLNAELMAAYRAIRVNPSNVAACLAALRPDKRTYYRLREIDPFSLSESELAARFLFINRLSFNAIFRTNRNGKFNVPYAKQKSRVKFDVDSIALLSKALKKATLLHCDFEEAIGDAKRGDFVYLDPPYAVSKRRVFAEYQAKSFATTDITRLRKSLCEIDQRGAHFVVSYADSAEGRKVANDWNWRRVRTRRNVAGFSGHRRFAYEVFATNVELRK